MSNVHGRVLLRKLIKFILVPPSVCVEQKEEVHSGSYVSVLQAAGWSEQHQRTSTFFLAGALGTFFFERTFDVASVGLFESINKGKLWKDIKHKYEQ